MRLVLSVLEQELLAQTAHVLLCPLDEPIDAWRRSVLRHLARLLEAEMGGFVLPTAEPPPYSLHNLPDEFAREYFASVQAVDPGTHAIQQLGGSVWSTRTLVQLTGQSIEDGWFGSAAYRDFYSRYGIEDGIGFVVPGTAPRLRAAAPPVPAAMLTCFHDVFGTPAFGERGMAKLRLLLPALEAGVAGRVRNAWVRDTFHELCDVVRDGLHICTADGRPLYANAALDRMLQNDPQSERIAAALDRATMELSSLLRTRQNGSPPQPPTSASTELRTAAARYRLRGHYVDGAPFGAGPAIIISVEQLTPELATPAVLQERWGLSPQEARVALLIADGLTNARVAEELGISPTTARHYTEAVFLKLRVRSRAAAARRVLVE